MRRLIPVIITLWLVSCGLFQLPQSQIPWQYTDLRALDAADAPIPSADILAVYTRTVNHEIQIRLDFLDHADTIDFDLYLVLDTREGGSTELPFDAPAVIEWDHLIVIPAYGDIQSFGNSAEDNSNLGIRVLRDPILDTIQISVNRSALESPDFAPWSKPDFNMSLYTTSSGSRIPSDYVGPLGFQDQPPLPAPVLFSFWNSMPAFNPSQALRKWDGAHTGPMGGRHGLFNLLRTAYSSGIHLVLLDITAPAGLSALDYFHGLDLVRSMQRDGLLTLPKALPDEDYSPIGFPESAVKSLLEKNDRILNQFKLLPQPFLYAPSGLPEIPTRYQVVFTKFQPPGNGISTMEVPTFHYRGLTIYPIPDYTKLDISNQAKLSGPSMDTRRALINTALSANSLADDEQPHILVLGGNLPGSTWGNPQIARTTFQYIASRPWIKPLDAHDLVSLRSSEDSSSTTIPWQTSSQSSQFQLPEEQSDELLTAFLNAPPNQLSQAAWDAYLALFNPVYPYSTDLPALRANYIPQIWSLIEAAKWADAPYTGIDCNQDFNRDEQPECILASEEFLTMIELDGGYLSFAFARTPTGIHQLIGPSSQFITGISDPMFWNADGGVYSDPRVIPGAFIDSDIQFNSDSIPEGLLLSSTDGSKTKQFQLVPNGIRIEYQIYPASTPVEVNIPLVIDPWNRFTSGWSDHYFQETNPHTYIWQSPSGLRIRIHTSGGLSSSAFIESRQFFSRPENPNQDYPPGHSLPFPMALVTIKDEGSFQTLIELDQ
ncbi:hypothetical protein ACFLV7_09925 [Chloroflexota bacterium]